MKKNKHLSLLLAAALISVSIYAQTETAKPMATTQPAPAKSSMLTPKNTLKMQPATKLPAATKPAQPAADTKAVPTGRQAQPVKPAGGVTK